MKKLTNCDLKSCSLCKGCAKDWLPALDINRQTFNYQKGEVIFQEGDPVQGIYFVVSGKIKVHRKWGDDKNLIIRFVKPGEIFGHRAMGEKNYSISATAMEKVSVCFIQYDFFISTLKVNHEYAHQLLMFFVEELKETERKMTYLALMSVKGRIAYCLLKIKEKFGADKQNAIDMSVSRSDIAAYAGTTYETAFRTMSEMAEKGLIKMDKKRIMLSNIKGLEACLQEELL